MEMNEFNKILKKVMEHNEYTPEMLTVTECDKKQKWTPTDLILREYYNNGGGSAKGFLGITTQECIEAYKFIKDNQNRMVHWNLSTKTAITIGVALCGQIIIFTRKELIMTTANIILKVMDLKNNHDWDGLYADIKNKKEYDFDSYSEQDLEPSFTILDQIYPASLKTCYKPPIVVYYKGDLNALDKVWRKNITTKGHSIYIDKELELIIYYASTSEITVFAETLRRRV